MSRLSIREEILQLVELIKMEKEAEMDIYLSSVANSSFHELRNMGLCWYPVKVLKTSYDFGERLLVRVARMPEHKHSHSFQSGKLVRLFSNAGNSVGEDDFVTAVINSADDREMLITINSDELPEWIDGNYLGVQLLFDENVYREMNAALQYMLETKEENINRLMHVLLGEQDARFTEKDKVQISALNDKQNEALNLINTALDVAIIHGPPGTGKTTTLVESIMQTLQTEAQVLVAAPSNAAVDLLVEKLNARAVQVVRLGHPARVTDEVLLTTLDARYSHHPDYKNLRVIRRKIDEYTKLAAKYKRNFGEAEREQRRLLYAEARKLKQEAQQLSYYITSDIISKAQVIACTLHGASADVLKGIRFKTVFLDEASQALEPASWIPIAKANRVVFAGDHKQLPPTIKSMKAAQMGLQNTLFEKSITRNKADVMLNVQYRMHEAIMEFSSQQFYNSELKAHPVVAKHLIFEADIPVEFVDTAGTGFFEEQNSETKSIYNKEEAALLVKHLQSYIHLVEESGSLRNLTSMGIISPYRAQTVILKEMINSDDILPDYLKTISSVNTVDSFQGQERDIIYISLTRSNEKSEIGFLSDLRRMNVAMTRARKKLVMIGDSATLASHPFYAKLLDYVQQYAVYKSAYEYIYQQ